MGNRDQWRILLNMLIKNGGPVAGFTKLNDEAQGPVADFSKHGNEGQGPVAVSSKHGNEG